MAYIDTNVFVYAAVENPQNPEADDSRAILEKIVAKKISASTSILTWDELVWVCKKALPLKESISEGQRLLNLQNLQVRECNVPIADAAGELMIKYVLKPRDAIHAATAILSGEKEIITDDADFDKVKELKRISLAEASR
ncbi:type II toxin-antitoxin system VapC family toxin [Candidatus Woesearchaeota archaeon]|nr:type II toxin-antitoxin system VapC family toxin [Candidatus Woesearchaeota archaeon]